jgi:alkylhydroperoxidase family enzyme
MVGHASTAFRPWLRYGGVLLTDLELDPLLRELAIMEVSHLEGSQYEWVQHDPITRAVGGNAEQIAAIEAGEVSGDAFDEAQSAVLAFTRAVATEGAASENQVARLQELIGDRAVVELLLVIGQYMSIARLVATLGVEPEAPADFSRLKGAGGGSSGADSPDGESS